MGLDVEDPLLKIISPAVIFLNSYKIFENGFRTF